MTAIQKQAMAILDRANANAMWTAEFGWIWKQNIRESETAARSIIEESK